MAKLGPPSESREIGSIDPAHFENLPGVADAIRVTQSYKLISRNHQDRKSVINVGNATIGGDDLAIIRVHAPLTRVNRFSLPPRLWLIAVHVSFADALSNRVHRHMLFKV